MESRLRFATLLLLTLCRRSHRGRQSFRDLRRGMPSRDCIVPIGVPTISSIVAWLCLRRCHVTPGSPDLFATGFRCLRKRFHLSNGIPSLLCDGPEQQSICSGVRTVKRLEYVFMTAVLLTVGLGVSVVRAQTAHWPEQEANAWYAQQLWLVGSNYIPKSVINRFMLFDSCWHPSPHLGLQHPPIPGGSQFRVGAESRRSGTRRRQSIPVAEGVLHRAFVLSFAKDDRILTYMGRVERARIR
jgi:hypothetical protein